MQQKNIFNPARAFRFRRFARRTFAVFNSIHREVNIGVVAFSMLTFAGATQTAAQSQPTVARDSISEHELDEVVVTGTRAELTQQQTARLVSVITRDEIARQPAQSVQDLLKSAAGLDVRQRGSNGVLAGIAIRGGTFEQTAILLNGANLTNPQTGHYNLDIPVNLSDIERIEIIQGPSSLLYGAGAFSGGINIVTRKDTSTGGSLNIEGGSHALRHASARGTLNTGNLNHSLSAGYSASDGYIENSDYRIVNALWQSRFQNDDAKIDFQAGMNDKSYGANTFYSAKYPNQHDETRTVFGAVKGETGTNFKIIPQLYWNRHYDHYQLIKNTATGENFHQTDVAGFNLNTRYSWAAGITTFGGEIRNESIVSSNLGKDTVVASNRYNYSDSRTNISYFLEHNVLLRRFTFSFGLLANYNTAFRDDFGIYPSIDAAFRVNREWKIFASWTNATRVPTFTDLSYRGLTHTGNSSVQPEKSASFDAGATFSKSFVTATVSAFYMRAIDPIDWVKAQSIDPWESRNLESFSKTGVETGVALRLSPVVLNLGYKFMHLDKKDADNLITYYLDDYIRHKFTAGLSHPIFKNLTADWQFRVQDRAGTYTEYQNLTAAGEVEYKPYALLDVKINYAFKNCAIYLKANNLFDTAYFDLGNIPQPGFWAMAGIEAKF